jgi:hypothetical protein
MDMNNQQAQPQPNPQVQSAIETGIKMLQSETISTPNAWNKDLTQLEQVLIGLLTGKLTLRMESPTAAATQKPFKRPETGAAGLEDGEENPADGGAE